MLRKTASAALKTLYGLAQRASRHAVDNHLERHLIEDFVRGDYGAGYGIDRAARETLVARMREVLAHVPSATRLLYHVVLARELLRVDPALPGDVVECGAYKGASSASLSLACALVKRKLWICDSFAGLPSAEREITRNYTHLKLQGQYAEGMYAGTLPEVRENVSRYGAIAQCEFIAGLFSDSLRAVGPTLVFAFLDVDLTSSMKDCIRHLWPRLVDDGVIYTDDSCDMEVVRVWFDDAWWQQELGSRAPGYVGSGCGLALSVAGSSLGYAQKVADVRKSYPQGPWLVAS